jgi:hypothetical protein
MNDDLTIRSDDLSLLRLALDGNRDYYNEMSELWRHLDTKAQGTIALGGILLAAFAGFITKSERAASCADRVLSVIAVALFTSGIAASALCLRLRQSSVPPHFGTLQSSIEDLLKIDKKDRENRMPDFVRELISAWKVTNEDTSRILSKKSAWLSVGQYLTVLSIVWLAVFAFMKILE